MKKIIQSSQKILFVISICLLLCTNINAQITLTEGFDGYTGDNSTIPAGWYIGWNSTSAPSFYSSNGNYGLAIPSYKFGVDGDTVISAAFATSNTLTFWIKGEGSTFSADDTLTILQSVDNGSTWDQIAPIYLDSIATTGTIMTFPINVYTTNIMFIFRKYVGNLAMDDIQLSWDTTSGINQIQNNTFDVVNIFPNPSNGRTFIQNNTSLTQKVKLAVYDMLGNEVLNFPAKNLVAGNNNLNLGSLNNGVYFIRIQNEKISEVHRITINK